LHRKFQLKKIHQLVCHYFVHLIGVILFVPLVLQTPVVLGVAFWRAIAASANTEEPNFIEALKKIRSLLSGRTAVSEQDSLERPIETDIQKQERLRRCRRRWGIFLFIFVLAFYPIRRWRAFHASRTWQDSWLSYLGVRAVGPPGHPELARTTQLLYAIEPHGCFPFGLAFAAVGPLRALLRIQRVVAATATAYVPVLRHVIGWIGGVDATPAAVDAALRAGHTVAVCPGGIAEMFWGVPRPGCAPDEEFALVLGRKGFVRLAVTERRFFFGGGGGQGVNEDKKAGEPNHGASPRCRLHA
jgi:hypothetical protein